MDGQKGQLASDPGKSTITAENGSAAMSEGQTGKKAEDEKNCSQLQKWVYGDISRRPHVLRKFGEVQVGREL